MFRMEPIFPVQAVVESVETPLPHTKFSIPLLANDNIKLQNPLYWHREIVRPFIDICHLSC
jgi:hypothetical protein